MSVFSNGSFYFVQGVPIRASVDAALACSRVSPSFVSGGSNQGGWNQVATQWHEATLVFASAHGGYNEYLIFHVNSVFT